MAKKRGTSLMDVPLLLWLNIVLLLAPTNLVAEKLTAFILCSARKKLANLLTFAVLNHSIQVYLSSLFVCFQKNTQVANPAFEIEHNLSIIFTYLFDQKHDVWPVNCLFFDFQSCSKKNLRDDQTILNLTIRLTILMVYWITITLGILSRRILTKKQSSVRVNFIKEACKIQILN